MPHRFPGAFAHTAEAGAGLGCDPAREGRKRAGRTRARRKRGPSLRRGRLPNTAKLCVALGSLSRPPPRSARGACSPAPAAVTGGRPRLGARLREPAEPSRGCQGAPPRAEGRGAGRGPGRELGGAVGGAGAGGAVGGAGARAGGAGGWGRGSRSGAGPGGGLWARPREAAAVAGLRRAPSRRCLEAVGLSAGSRTRAQLRSPHPASGPAQRAPGPPTSAGTCRAGRGARRAERLR